MSSPKNMNTPKTWGNLSMKEKADIMKVAVQNGLLIGMILIYLEEEA